ncbi:MAG: ABC transporter permease [Campylobacteraceae bacterium]|jgi:D-methionine transport system permease protein|nr:ABC transporter permease [Campylobacteraceae bacterium]
MSDKFIAVTKLMFQALFETLYMSLASTFFAVLIGFAISVVLIMTDKNGLSPNRYIYGSLDVIVNTFRSFPFIILIIILFPFTKIIIGKITGTTASIVPLTIGAAPFVARLFENAFKEVHYGIIEAAKSFGASKLQIIFKVMLPEAMPSIVSAITLTLIVIVGFSAMAGTVGGGGLGQIAIQYGYNGFQADILFYTVVILIVLVQIFQIFGNLVYKVIKH